MKQEHCQTLKRLFHYTRASKLKQILETQSITTTDVFIDGGEKPAVWFSFSQDFEPTAVPGLEGGEVITFKQMTEIDTPARIEIDPSAAPMTWRVWRKLSGVKPRTARALEESALRLNANIADWRMSFEPVTVASGAWWAVELFVGDQWQNFEKVFKMKS